MALWLCILFALIGGEVPTIKNVGQRVVSLIAAGYLVGVLLVWVVPHLFAPVQFGALVMLASWPYTYWAIVPLNNRILGLIGADAAHDARKVIDLWGRLELGQTAIGVLGLIIFVWAAG